MIRFRDISANEGGLPSANIGKPVRSDTRDENFPALGEPVRGSIGMPDDPGPRYVTPGGKFDASSPAYRQGWIDGYEAVNGVHPFIAERRTQPVWVFIAGMAAGALVCALLSMTATLWLSLQAVQP